MTASFKTMADATRTVSKKTFGTPNNGARFNEQTMVNELTQELIRRNPKVNVTNPTRLNRVWDPKKESLPANGVSEKVISYSETMKANIVAAESKFSDKVKSGTLDTKELIAYTSQVFTDMEKVIINERNLSLSEKLTLIASTTAGIELAPAFVEMYLDYNNMLISNRGWNWRAIGNAILNIVVVVAVIALAVTVVGAVASAAVASISAAVAAGTMTAATAAVAIGAAYVAQIAADATLLVSGINALWGVLFDCRGFCVWDEDECYCK
jgi:hypothetical protein